MPEHRIYRFPQWHETPYKHIIMPHHHGGNQEERAEPTPQVLLED